MPPVYNNIQALRGIAALMVFSSHVLAVRWGMGVDWLALRYGYIGPAGVDIFFVISGFIVSMTAARLGQTGQSNLHKARHFALRRIFRIYPVYWVVLLLAFLSAPPLELAPPWLPHRNIFQLALLATPVNHKVMLAWTLCYEMYFYLVLAAMLLVFPRAVFRCLAIWGAVSAILIFLCWKYRPDRLDTVSTSPFLLEFLYGCAIAWLVRNGMRRLGWTALLLGLAWFVVSCDVNMGVGQWQPKWRAVLFGISGALIVYGLVSLESRRQLSLPRFLTATGDASYSIYIWHQLVIAGLLWGSERAGLLAAVPGPALLIAWFALTLAAGFLGHRLIERPSHLWLNRRFAPGQRRFGDLTAG
jgi:exopolysaccharide production protein ExoZ